MQKRTVWSRYSQIRKFAILNDCFIFCCAMEERTLLMFEIALWLTQPWELFAAKIRVSLTRWKLNPPGHLVRISWQTFVRSTLLSRQEVLPLTVFSESPTPNLRKTCRCNCSQTRRCELAVLISGLLCRKMSSNSLEQMWLMPAWAGLLPIEPIDMFEMHTVIPDFFLSLCRYNGSIYVYGQTGSGKTYTMQGAVVRNLPVRDGQFNLFVIYFKRWEYSAENMFFSLHPSEGLCAINAPRRKKVPGNERCQLVAPCIPAPAPFFGFLWM